MIGGTVYVRDAFTTNDKFIVHDESAINCKSFIMEDSGSFEMCGGTFYAPNATIRVRGNVLIAGSSRDDAVRFSVGEDDGERDTVFAQPFYERKVYLLRFVPAINQDEEIRELFAAEDV